MGRFRSWSSISLAAADKQACVQPRMEWLSRQSGRRHSVCFAEKADVALVNSAFTSARTRLACGSPHRHILHMILEGTWRNRPSCPGLPASWNEAVQ